MFNLEEEKKFWSVYEGTPLYPRIITLFRIIEDIEEEKKYLNRMYNSVKIQLNVYKKGVDFFTKLKK